jgi:subtilisin family serine protease
MTGKRWVLGLALVAALLAVPLARAGEIEAPFDEVLAAAGADQFVRGIVVLADRVDVPALSAALDARKATLAQRHETVVRALVARAKRTQGPLLSLLKDYQSEGLVRSYQGLWIENEITVVAVPEVFWDLADRADVAVAAMDPAIEGVAPFEEKAAPEFAAGVENGLTVIRAPELWAMGITGSGVLVGNLDTGVDGNHVALKDRWRGLDAGVPASAAWFDPVTSTTFPFDAGSHGTHTMGTIAGKSGADIIGVAYDAKWIAAGVIDRVNIARTYSDALLAFQWAADPDGNPGTTSDVPDVISNSWGLTTSMGYPACDSYLWTAIDNVEAAGAVVVFAAGNEGSGAQTIRIPADRIATSVSTFSVGALEQDGTTIASFSSRGPSDCDGSTIKPEVAAVGVDVRSSVPGNSYTTMSGTSMATPHVAGAAALLRQAKPDATADQIKTALYLSAFDLGAVGEDNTFGHGRIDLVAALAFLGGLEEMATITGTVTVSGSGTPITGATVALEGTSYSGTTNADGDYTILAPGDVSYTITASAFGFGSSSLSAYCPKNATTYADFALVAGPTGTIQGTTFDSDGNALGGVTVRVQNHVWPSVTSNGSGFYSLIVPGGYTYDLTASKTDYYDDAISGLSVGVGGVVTYDFHLTAQGGGGICFAAKVAGTAAAGTLDSYRALRDGLLTRSKLGQELAYTYYQRGPEMIRIAAKNPGLAADTLRALKAYAPRARAASRLKDLTDLRLTAQEKAEFRGLIHRYARTASPELRSELERFSRLLDRWSARPVSAPRVR